MTELEKRIARMIVERQRLVRGMVRLDFDGNMSVMDAVVLAREIIAVVQEKETAG